MCRALKESDKEFDAAIALLRENGGDPALLHMALGNKSQNSAIRELHDMSAKHQEMLANGKFDNRVIKVMKAWFLSKEATAEFRERVEALRDLRIAGWSKRFLLGAGGILCAVIGGLLTYIIIGAV